MLKLILSNYRLILFVIAAASLTSIYVNIKNSIRDLAEAEVVVEQQQEYIDTRKRIDEAVSTDKSVDAATERLRDRQRQRLQEQSE